MKKQIENIIGMLNMGVITEAQATNKLLNLHLVSQRSELLKVFIEWYNEEFSNYDELPEHIIDMFIKQTFNCG